MSDSSDEDAAASERSEVMRNLYWLIAGVQSSGSFATFGNIDSFINPGIHVDPIGIVRLPLSEDDAQAIIRRSNKAPFGKGNETLIDESVRKTWQIDAANIRFLNPDWQSCLDSIVENAARRLGVPYGSSEVRADFYKMLLYEKGALFKPHQEFTLPMVQSGIMTNIEPILTGYRWVLTYNLINQSQNAPQSASIQDQRVKELTQALTRWEDLDDDTHYLVYPLSHQYSDQNLKLAQLKGGDRDRVHHVTQACAANDGHYSFLCNMEMCVTDPNCEEQMEKETALLLCRAVTTEGINLLPNNRNIAELNLLHGSSYQDRDPDVQRGGEYTGNQYAEIDQWFKDSALIIVQRNYLDCFLLSLGYHHSSLGWLITTLKENIEANSMRGLLLQICQLVLGREYKSGKDLYLGPVAVGAVYLKDSYLFSEAIMQLKGSLGGNYYSKLGQILDLQDLVVQEDEYLNHAITRCGTIHQTRRNLNQFRDGFSKGNASRTDQLHINYLNRWLDTLLYGCLCAIKDATEHDASTIVNIVLERESWPFSQFLLYQGVRTFVESHQNDSLFIVPVVVELLSHSDQEGNTKKFLDALLRKNIKSAIGNWNFSQYAAYNISCHAASQQYGYSPGSRIQYGLAGPIQKLFEYISAHDQSLFCHLLEKIHSQAADLIDDQCNAFLFSFLHELIKILGISSPQPRQCIRTLISQHIIRTVGHEPHQPRDWSRPEETVTCDREPCAGCAKMNEFLKDPVASYLALDDSIEYHVRYQFHGYQYFDQKKSGWNPPTGVTKTMKWWDESHKKWQARADKVSKALKKLPQDSLKGFLGDEYDEIMDLKMVKVVDDLMEIDGGGNSKAGCESGVPQKRARESPE
ncbi:MAG: hypothetical protein Q9219_007223 [cf. Caloplaca sp. 3 TL-2023]